MVLMHPDVMHLRVNMTDRHYPRYKQEENMLDNVTFTYNLISSE